MPVYNKQLTKLNFNRNFRVGSSTWNSFESYTANVPATRLWIRESGGVFRDFANYNSAQPTHTGATYLSTKGPNWRFPIQGLRPEYASATVPTRITLDDVRNFYPGYDQESTYETIISGWIKVDRYNAGGGSSGSSILEISTASTKATIAESNSYLSVFIDSSGDFTIRFGDGTDWVKVTAQNNKLPPTGQWFNFVVVVPDSTNSTGEGEISQADLASTKIYIDGRYTGTPTIAAKNSADLTVPSSGTYYAYIGYGMGEDNLSSMEGPVDFDGEIAEIAIHKHSGFGSYSDIDIRKIFYRGAIQGVNQLASGVTNINPYVRRAEDQNRDYNPTILSGMDSRRRGNTPSIFNDTQVPQISGSTLSYPARLFNSDPLLNTIYSGQFVNLDIEVPTTRSFNEVADFKIYEDYFDRDEQPVLDPFVESRIYSPGTGSKGDFFTTGSLNIGGEATGSFSKSLKSKVAIVIDMPIRPTGGNLSENKYAPENSYQDQPTYDDSKDFPLMFYYDKDNKQFSARRGFKSGTSPFEVSYGGNTNTNNTILFTYQRDAFDQACIGFSPFGLDGHVKNSSLTPVTREISDVQTMFNLQGEPITNFGFPFHGKYHATSSMLIDMSEYISKPFLAEKMLVEYSASYRIPVDPTSAPGADYAARHGYSLISERDDGSGGLEYRASAQDMMGYSNALVGQTFFLLRQFQDRNNISVPHVWARNDHLSASVESKDFTIDGAPQEHIYYVTSSVPGSFRLHNQTVNGGFGYAKASSNIGETLTYVDTNRELLTYGKILVNRSGSHLYNTSQPIRHQAFLSGSNFDKLIETNKAGFVPSDENDFNADSAQISEHFVVEIPFRNSIKNDYISRILTRGAPPNVGEPTSFSKNSGTYVLANQFGQSMNVDSMSNRSFTNAVSGFEPNTKTAAIVGGESSSYFPLLDNVTRTVVSTTKISSPAPKVLFPEDKLIFGIQNPLVRNTTTFLFPRLNDNNLAFQSEYGDMKITIFGSYLQDEKPKPVNLNQSPQFTQAVSRDYFEEIHDEHDLSELGSFQGSYVDDVMSGSVAPAFTEDLFRTYTSLIDSKNIVGSDVSAAVYPGQTGDPLSRSVGSRQTEGTVGDQGTLRRVIRHLFEGEYEEHSVPKRYSDLALVSEGAITQQIVSNPSIDVIYNLIGGHEGAGPSTTGLPGVTADSYFGFLSWPFAFPFEKKFRRVQKSFSPVKRNKINHVILRPNFGKTSGGGFGTVASGQGWDSVIQIASNEYTRLAMSASNFTDYRDLSGDSDYSNNDIGLGAAGVDSQTLMITGSFDVTDYEIANVASAGAFKDANSWGDIAARNTIKILHGIGSANRGRHVALQVFKSDDGGGDEDGADARMILDHPRGTKYGYSNLFPTPSTIVFRRDRFGQFRDMLEQSLNTHSVNVGFNVIRQQAVTARFCDLENPSQNIDPYLTHRGNKDIYSRTSYPFLDQEPVEDTDTFTGTPVSDTLLSPSENLNDYMVLNRKNNTTIISAAAQDFIDDGNSFLS